MKLIKVILLAQMGDVSIVEYDGKSYEVDSNKLRNCGREGTPQGWINFCYINPRYLTKLWA